MKKSFSVNFIFKMIFIILLNFDLYVLCDCNKDFYGNWKGTGKGNVLRFIRRLRFAGTTRRIAPKGLPKREPEYDEPRRKGKEPHPAQTGSALSPRVCRTCRIRSGKSV